MVCVLNKTKNVVYGLDDSTNIRGLDLINLSKIFKKVKKFIIIIEDHGKLFNVSV